MMGSRGLRQDPSSRHLCVSYEVDRVVGSATSFGIGSVILSVRSIRKTEVRQKM